MKLKAIAATLAILGVAAAVHAESTASRNAAGRVVAVRAGKLYYLRGLEGKKARIKEDLSASAKAKNEKARADKAAAAAAPAAAAE